ncbi:SPOR domain-containing protein [Rugamonas sp. DEMB1]|uniref:SPOR domain-containing protein n=1 Tax=Rugamonas sp. DEMB1 TaxID=3039386 RepID=UPI0024489278|nr:SPOR domain-containing protein [Rugamonas sp. DEMB1]WGG49752.1 SPOR domain-containing protein [Rugamonas sp. DEMB1]
MLKFIFWSLLAANAALFAYGQGYLGHFSGNEREPARLRNQLNGGRLTLVSAERANGAAAAADTAGSPAAAAKPAPPQLLACLEIGNFVLADARRFEAQLAPLGLGDRQARHNLPGTEVSSYIVFIPPQGSKEAADKKAAELKQLGVSNYFVMSDNSAMRWAISLGVFKTEPAAQNLLAALQKQGVRSAKLAPRMSGSKLLAYQFRDVDATLKGKLEQLRAGHPGTEARACK